MKKIIALITGLLVIFSFLTFNRAEAAASFAISGPAIVRTGQTITLTISSNRNVAYNAVTVNVSFNNFIYVGVSTTGGWTPVAGPSRSGNSVSFSGGLLGKSVTGSTGVLVLTLKAPPTPGTASIFVSGTLDGTGLGTGAENGSGSRSYNVQAAPTPTPTPKPTPDAVTVSSTTHPDQNAWYQRTDVIINWVKGPEVTDFSYLLDQSPTTTPDDISEGGDISKVFNNVPEGINYFHIKAKNSVGWGPTSHFTIKIDKSSPDPFTPTSVKNSDGSFTLYFASNDKFSESLVYYINVDGIDLGVKTSGVVLPQGTKEVIITAKDLAGNTTISTYNFDTSNTASTLITEDRNTENTENQNNPKFLNAQNALLIIIIVMLLIYAVIITTLYLMEKGILRTISQKTES